MSNVLIVLGSAREGRVADKILGYVQNEIANRSDLTATVADLKEINLPFFENPISPAQPGYAPTDDSYLAWQKLVNDNDAVILITPEYNHGLSAIEKNALDTLHKEWKDKPIVAIAYGWTGGSRSIEVLNDLIPHLGAEFKANPAQLAFMKDINPDGTLIDEAGVAAQIKTALDEIA